MSPCFAAIKVDHVIQAFDKAVRRQINGAKMEQQHEAQEKIETGYKLVESPASMNRDGRGWGLP